MFTLCFTFDIHWQNLLYLYLKKFLYPLLHKCTTDIFIYSLQDFRLSWNIIENWQHTSKVQAEIGQSWKCSFFLVLNNDEVVSQLLNTCRKSSRSLKVCWCLLSGIIRNFTPSRFQNIDRIMLESQRNPLND